MKLCTQTKRLFDLLGPKVATEVFAEAGFDLLDLSMTGMKDPNHPFYQEDYLQQIDEIRGYAEAHGMSYYQAHAPFGWDVTETPEEHYLGQIIRSMECASRVGSSCIVIHPFALADRSKQDEFNTRIYEKLLPKAKKLNLTILTENMFEYNHRRKTILPNVLSFGTELAAFSDHMNDPNFGVCLDLGHSGLVGDDAPTAIRALGKERLTAVHVHDNDYVRDMHTIPYLGKMEWNEICQALGEIDYQGVFTMEADGFYAEYPAEKEALLAGAKFMVNTARNLMDKVNAARP